MREIRPSGSEGGGTETNRSFLPLSKQPWPNNAISVSMWGRKAAA